MPLLIIAIAALAIPAFAAPNLEPAAQAEMESLGELYRWLHSHPELSFREEETAKKLISELEPLGFDVTPNFGGYGFVAVLRNGDGPTVMVRTDLDALPVVENTGKPYMSDVRVTDDYGNNVGVMHACGHDVHMTTFVGTARLLAKSKGAWKGTVIFIGQPAEERGAGALAMLEDGLFEKFPRPDFVLATHVIPTIPAGKIGVVPGYMMANVDSVDITVKGVGGHGAYPHMTKDPVVIAAQIVLGLQTIVSREVSPLDSAVVTVGSIHGGAKHNIISEEVSLQLTVRTYKDETREHVLAAIKRIAESMGRAAGLPDDLLPVVGLTRGDAYTPALYNEPELSQRLMSVWKAALGEDNVWEVEPVMGGEDFARYGRVEPKIPTHMFRLGAMEPGWFAESQKPGGRKLPSLHSPIFGPDYEPAVKTGVQAMTAAVLELMGR